MLDGFRKKPQPLTQPTPGLPDRRQYRWPSFKSGAGKGGPTAGKGATLSKAAAAGPQHSEANAASGMSFDLSGEVVRGILYAPPNAQMPRSRPTFEPYVFSTPRCGFAAVKALSTEITQHS
jgi:hypothetical protein